MDFLPLFATHVTGIFSPYGHRIAILDLRVFSDHNAKSSMAHFHSIQRNFSMVKISANIVWG